MFSERSFRELLAVATDATSLHRLFSTWEPAS
jgi:hypothetical protein